MYTSIYMDGWIVVTMVITVNEAANRFSPGKKKEKRHNYIHWTNRIRWHNVIWDKFYTLNYEGECTYTSKL